MIDLKIVAEGDSEETFCKQVLAPHLFKFDVYATPIKVETSHLRHRPDIKFKGGVTTYKHVKKDILNFLCYDQRETLRVTTFLDYFRLPSDFPGFQLGVGDMTRDEEIDLLERSFREDIQDSRFLPYIQKHEFETLLFVDLKRLVELYPGHASKVDRIVRGAAGVAPENVNGGASTAPSKRILAEFSEHKWNKPRIVPILAEIGLPALRHQCTRFDAWVSKLENLK